MVCYEDTSIAFANFTRATLLALDSLGSDLGNRSRAERVELCHLRLLRHKATTRVRVPVKTEGRNSDALSRERFPKTQQTERHAERGHP